MDGGTIDPTGASINTETGFSIITYTGNGSAGATVAHGLGKKPEWIIIKRRDASDNWMVYHHEIDASSPEDYYFELNATGQRVDSTIMLNDTAPTSTLITLGSDPSVNANTVTYIMYSWTGIPGYSKFGSYEGNGSTNGPYADCGFSPRWFMTRRVEGGSNAYIWDTAREPANLNNSPLQANDPGSEPANYDNYFDILSNGFKSRSSNAGTNSNDDRYVFMAFAEQPGITPFDTFANSR